MRRESRDREGEEKRRGEKDEREGSEGRAIYSLSEIDGVRHSNGCNIPMDATFQ